MKLTEPHMNLAQVAYSLILRDQREAIEWHKIRSVKVINKEIRTRDKESSYINNGSAKDCRKVLKRVLLEATGSTYKWIKDRVIHKKTW